MLFEICVLGSNYRFFMNTPEYSAYSTEEEVLLSDGLRCKITDIRKIKEGNRFQTEDEGTILQNPMDGAQDGLATALDLPDGELAVAALHTNENKNGQEDI